MKKIIIAMGGGFFGERKDVYDDWYPGIDQMFFPVETTPIDRLIVESTGKKNPTVLVITTASEGGERDVDLYMSAFRKQYEPIGAKIEELRLIQQEETHEEIVAKIGRADAVYVTPGDTSLLIKTWRKRGVDELLRVAYESGTVMSGLSAGACCWFDFFLCWIMHGEVADFEKTERMEKGVESMSGLRNLLPVERLAMRDTAMPAFLAAHNKSANHDQIRPYCYDLF
jgi:hypothetical protein